MSYHKTKITCPKCGEALHIHHKKNKAKCPCGRGFRIEVMCKNKEGIALRLVPMEATLISVKEAIQNDEVQKLRKKLESDGVSGGKSDVPCMRKIKLCHRTGKCTRLGGLK